jgi:hypothetical protein
VDELVRANVLEEVELDDVPTLDSDDWLYPSLLELELELELVPKDELPELIDDWLCPSLELVEEEDVELDIPMDELCDEIDERLYWLLELDVELDMPIEELSEEILYWLLELDDVPLSELLDDPHGIDMTLPPPAGG